MTLTLWILNTNNQHMLCKPALSVGLPRSKTQRVAFLAKQGVSTVTRPYRLNGQLFGKMHDETAVRGKISRGVETLDEGPLFLDTFKGFFTHACHNSHIDHNVGAV